MICDKCEINFEEVNFEKIENLEHHKEYLKDFGECLCESCSENEQESVWYGSVQMGWK